MKNINKEVEQVVIGTMLGDASLNSKGRYRFRQMNLQYCSFVQKKLQSLQLCALSNRQSGLVSSSDDMFKDLRLIWYKNGRKIIPTYVFVKLDKQAIAHLIMDDGSCSKWTGQIRIATNCFSKEENEKLCEVINGLLGKVAYVHWIKYKQYYRIHFKPSSLQEVRRQLQKYFCSSMLYKLGVNNV